jgi:predicted DsbA family dithiol-disulfide isomerase
MNLVVHPQVQLGHQYGCAAAKQGKFLPFTHAFWEKAFKAGNVEEPNILKLSGEIGLDVARLKTDANGAECQQRVKDDMAELAKFNVNGTPGFFVNGTFVGGAIPKEGFKQLIEQKLKLIEASKVPAAQYYEKEILGKGSKQFRSIVDAERDKRNATPPAGGSGSGAAEKAP